MAVCAVVGCFSSKRKKDKRFFRVPSIIANQGSETQILSENRHGKWLSRIRRTDLLESNTAVKHLRVCSDHFVSGAPARLYDRENPDWLPSLKLSDSKNTNDRKVVRTYERYMRYKARNNKRTENAAKNPKLDGNNDVKSVRIESENENTETRMTNAQQVNNDESNSHAHIVSHAKNIFSPQRKDNLIRGKCKDVSVQTNRSYTDIFRLDLDNRFLVHEVTSLKKKVFSVSLAEETFLENDSKITAYTGLPSWEVFYQLYCTIEDHVEAVPGMSKFLMLLVTLMRLKLNVNPSYLAIIFNKSESAINTSFQQIVNIISETMSSFLQWPSQTAMYKSLTSSFKKLFSKGVIIVDIINMPIDLPVEVESNGIESVKFVIAMSIQKNWIFVSDLINSNVSTKEVIEKSDVLSQLERGNFLLCGLNIMSNVTNTFCGTFEDDDNGDRTLVCSEKIQQRLGNKIRYHMVRATGQLRRKFGILNSSVSLSFVTGNEPFIRKVIQSCCIISNFSNKNVCFHKHA